MKTRAPRSQGPHAAGPLAADEAPVAPAARPPLRADDVADDVLATIEVRLREVRALQRADAAYAAYAGTAAAHRAPDPARWGPVAAAWLGAAETIARGDLQLGLARGREAAALEALRGASASPCPLPDRVPSGPLAARAVPRAIRTLAAVVRDAPRGGGALPAEPPLATPSPRAAQEPDDDEHDDGDP